MVSGYYLWIPTREKGDHLLDEERVVLVARKRVYIFGSIKSWAISEAQTVYGMLGAKLYNTIKK